MCMSNKESAGVIPTPAKQILEKQPKKLPIRENKNDLGFELCNEGRNKKYVKKENQVQKLHIEVNRLKNVLKNVKLNIKTLHDLNLNLELVQ